MLLLFKLYLKKWMNALFQLENSIPSVQNGQTEEAEMGESMDELSDTIKQLDKVDSY